VQEVQQSAEVGRSGQAGRPGGIGWDGWESTDEQSINAVFCPLEKRGLSVESRHNTMLQLTRLLNPPQVDGRDGPSGKGRWRGVPNIELRAMGGGGAVWRCLAGAVLVRYLLWKYRRRIAALERAAQRPSPS
jgi:hypothetical protein